MNAQQQNRRIYSISKITNSKDLDDTTKKAEDGKVSVFDSEYWNLSGKIGSANASLADTFQNAMTGITRIAHAPGLMLRHLFELMVSSISGMADYFSENMPELSGSSNTTVGSGVASTTAVNGGDASSGTAAYINYDGTTITSEKKGSKNVNNNTSSSSKKKGFWGWIKGLFGKGTSEPQYGMGYSKQIDPLISSIRYNSYNDSDYQTIGNSGCGPAAAVNAIEAMYGRGSESIVKAASFAVKNG